MALQTATNPQTGERVALIGDQWQPIKESATNKEGVKAFLIGDSWLTDEPTPSEGTRANVGAEVPAWAKEYPKLYSAAVKARQIAGPSVEMLGGMVGGVVGYVAGFTAPEGKTMGHAGAIVSGSSGTAQGKKDALEAAGVKVGQTPSETARLLRAILGR
jgi:hypothetical protein